MIRAKTTFTCDRTDTTLRSLCLKLLMLIPLMSILPHMSRAQVAMEQPSGEIILQVTGPLLQTNDGDGAIFDIAMLRAISNDRLETTTRWTSGMQVFEGIWLHRLMTYLGAEGSDIDVTAFNDYTARIPGEDIIPGGAFLAHSMNGEPMSPRDKGPLWVVYPYDSDSHWRTEIINHRSVWQVHKIQIIKADLETRRLVQQTAENRATAALTRADLQ